MKAIQVLTKGDLFGNIYILNNSNSMAMNLFDSDDLVSKHELKLLTTREVGIEYTPRTGQHLNVNVLHPDKLIDLHTALTKRELGLELSSKEQRLLDDTTQLTLRVSGFAVRFHSLMEEQRKDVIKRTFHAGL